MMDLEALIASIDIDTVEFKENLMAVLVETRSSEVMAEHFLAAMVQTRKSFSGRRIKRQNVEPHHVVEVIKGCVEDAATRSARIENFKDAPLDAKVQAITAEIESFITISGKSTVPENSFLSLIVSKIHKETVEGLILYAFVNWELFIKDLVWPPETGRQTLELWHPKTQVLLTERAFDKTGRKLISILISEIEGLGMREYTLEALFIALISIEPSVLDLAIRTQMLSKKSQFTSTNDLVSELRTRVRRPRNITLTREIERSKCSADLIVIFEKAALIAQMDSRQRVSNRDMAEAFVFCEAGGRFDKMINNFGVDLEKALAFLEQYEEEQEEEDALVRHDQLEQKIKQGIIGQDHAVKRILPLIKRLRFGYRRPGKPAGVFLFMGPSGTGKTQMAKILAKTLYGSSDSLLMLEMGQFGTKESKSMFIGSPPGYVGYGEGKLTNGLRDKPESVILFDEVEKADPLVFDVLLRFLDEGQIDDPAGPVRDGSKCLIILTSNFLADALAKFEKELSNPDEAAQERMYRDLREELLNQGKAGSDEKIKKFFRPEFVFRIDEIILFRSFNLDDYREIARMAVNSETEYIKEQFEYDVTYDDSILEKIADECVLRKNEGARVVNRLVNVNVVNPLIDYFSSRDGEFPGAIHLSMGQENNAITIEER